MVEEHQRKSLNHNDRQATSRVSPQYKNVFTTRDDSYRSSEMHEDAIPVKSKINNERKSKKYSKPASNVNTNNRKMTGNVNIYICSETKSPEKSKRSLKLQSCTETSSDMITEQSNSRCISASSASSCRLLNSIQEKRRILQAKQLTNSVHQEKNGSSDNSDNNAVRDNKTSHKSYRKKSSESSKEQMDAKVTDEDAECRDTTSRDSTRDGCCCRDPTDPSFSSADLSQDSLDSVISRLRFSKCDESACPRSWTKIYPSETRARMDDSDGSSLNAICAERRNQYRNDEQSNVCKNDEYITCDVIDDSSYTDCAKVGDNISKECFADSCKYRNERLQQLMLNCTDIWWKQAGCKLLQESPENCRKEPATRQWSTCSCIAEEEEDRCANVGRGEKERPEDPCDNVQCSEKIFVCRAPSSALIETATVCEILPFRNTGERCDGTPARESTFGDSAECPRDATVCGTTFENSEEPPKVTRVCKEFVAGKPPKDIAVCGATFGEPKGPPEEVTVCESALLDSGGAPKETISKTIPDSNFAGQDDVEGVSLNDAKDKLVRENTDIANLNNQKENVGNVGSAVQSDDKYNIVASNNLTELRSAKNVRNPIPVGSIGDSKSLSRNVYSAALAHTELRNRLNFTSNHNPRKILKIPFDKHQAKMKLPPLDRATKVHVQQQNEVAKDFTTRDLTLNKNNHVNENIPEKSKEKEEIQDTPEEKEMTEEKPRESILHRSIKKLIDIIKHYRAQSKDRIETRKIEEKKTIMDNKEDVMQPEIISEIREKVDDEKEQPDVSKRIQIKEIEDTAHIVRPKPTAPIADFTVPEEDKKTDVSSANQVRLVPKLLRVIAAKRSRLLPIVTATTEPKPQESEVESVLADIAIKGYAAREEIPQEKIIPQVTIQEEIISQKKAIPRKKVSKKPIVEFTEEIKAKESLAPKIDVDKVKATAKDIDISESVVDKDVISKEFTDAVTKIYVPCPKKTAEEESQEIVPCKYDPLSDPFDYSCSTAKCTGVRVSCPQKKLEEEQYESIVCKCKLHSVSKDCSKLIAKCTKYNNAFDGCVCKINGLEQKKECQSYCHSSIEQCTCVSTRYLKSCLKTDKPKFRNVSPLRDSPHFCTNCYREKEECTCRETVIRCQPYEDCRCKCTARNNCSRMIDRHDCRCRSPARCIYAQSKNQSWPTTFDLMERCKIKKGSYNCKKTMICVYCDNPQDKCTCRAPVGKCSRCGLSSDVCDCRNDGGDDPGRKRVAGEPAECRTIQVTSWKPKREIRRYFARDSTDLRSDFTEECRCCERLKWQRPEELPYQRLNVFSDVMNELQQKMSESVCCTRCRRNPCRCGSQVNQDERVEGRKANGYVRCPEAQKSLRRVNHQRNKRPRSKSSRNMSPNNYRCNSSPGNERRSTVEKSAQIRHVGCVCKLSPCRCRKGRPSHRRPLAKCYYCKSLPCNCIIAR